MYVLNWWLINGAARINSNTKIYWNLDSNHEAEDSGTVTNGLQSGRTKAGAKLTLGVPTSPTPHSGRQYPLGITQCHYQDGSKSWYWGEGKRVCDEIERLAFEQKVVSSISEGLKAAPRSRETLGNLAPKVYVQRYYEKLWEKHEYIGFPGTLR